MSDDEGFELVRPEGFATDREWAQAVTEDLWVMEERLHEAHDVLRATIANVNAWSEYEKTLASERQEP